MPETLPEHIDGVLALGAGIDSELSAARGQPAINNAGDRLIVLAELALKYPQAKIVYSGGSANLIGGSDIREADIARDLLRRLGLPENRVLFERESRNTLENALFSKKLVNPQAEEKWLLITSAYHMPRSIGIFRQIDWPVIPYPVDYTLPLQGSGSPWTLLDGLTGVHWASREWLGLVYYWATRRTDSLFPSP